MFAAFGKPRQKPAAPYTASVVYFACLGFGFIAVELALLQNLTLLQRNLDLHGRADA